LAVGNYYGFFSSFINNGVAKNCHYGINELNAVSATPASAINNVFISGNYYVERFSSTTSASKKVYFSNVYAGFSTAGERASALTATLTAAPMY